MLSGRRFGIVAGVGSWQQNIIISRCLLRSSPSHSPPPSLSTPQSFSPVRPVLKIGSSFNASRSFSSDRSSSSCNSSCVQQRNGSSRRKHSVNSSSVNSVPSFSTRLRTGGASYYGAPSALSPPLCSHSVFLRTLGMEQQQLHRNRRNRRSQQKNTISVEAIASIDEQETELNQNNSLQEELQRYGVHESDYTCLTVEQKPTRGSSSMPGKRKASADLANRRKHQHTNSKGKPVVQDWCCYLLLSVDSKKTYVGVTFDITRSTMGRFQAVLNLPEQEDLGDGFVQYMDSIRAVKLVNLNGDGSHLQRNTHLSFNDSQKLWNHLWSHADEQLWRRFLNQKRSGPISTFSGMPIRFLRSILEIIETSVGEGVGDIIKLVFVKGENESQLSIVVA